jgi:hypothetical protein
MSQTWKSITPSATVAIGVTNWCTQMAYGSMRFLFSAFHTP